VSTEVLARPPLRLCLDDVDGHPALDTAVSRTVLERVDEGALPATLRLSRPPRVVAFSSRDARVPGFDAAAAAAREHGFAPILRLAGGRAAVFTPSTIAFAWAVPAAQPAAGIEDRFAVLSGCLRDAFAAVGVDARIGEVAGEYCPGSWSVNAGGTRKLAGVGQRLLRRAAHTGGVVVVDGADEVNDVLRPVYAAMDVGFDPEVTGDVLGAATRLRSEGPDAAWRRVRDAIVDAFAERFTLEPWSLDDATLSRAREAADDHLVPEPVA
jgi:octanoyl-[GcvH]:protein N-octanoyltransferase